MDNISLADFVSYLDAAISTYPNAHIVSVGTGVHNNEWYFGVWIRDNESREVCIEIPCRTK